MDSYYLTLNAIGSEPERLSFAKYVQTIMSDIDRNAQYSKDSSTININDDIVPSGMTFGYRESYISGIKAFVGAGKSQGGKYYENPKQSYSVFPGYTLVGWGVNAGASGINLTGDVSLVWFDKSKFSDKVKTTYDNWELPFVYKSCGFDIDGKGSATTAVEFGEAMMANKNYKLKASLSGQAVGIFVKDSCDDFDPVNLEGDGKNYGATVAYAKVDVSFAKEGNVTVVKVGPSTDSLNLNSGASHSTLLDKDDTDIFFTPKPYELTKDK